MDGPTPRPELPRPDGPAPLEAWAGIECSRVRVKRRIVDQVALTGHRDRLADIERIAGLGVRACRYPVLWEHVAPRGLATADWTWADDRLGRLRAAGVRPIVGLLHHGGGPRGMSLRHPAFPAAFARYAAAVARRFPWLLDYLPINEPLTTARFAGLYGVWHPHAAAPEPFARLLIGQCLAIRAAMRAVRTVQPAARLIVNEDVGRTSGTVACADLAVEYQTRRWATWNLLFGRVDRHHPMQAIPR